MTLTPDQVAWQAVVAEFLPRARRWPSPLTLAQQLDHTVRRTPALDLVDSALVDVANGACERLMVFMPPQEGKSETVSRRFPTWLLSHDRNLRIGIASYELETAMRWGRTIRDDARTFDGTDDQVDLGIRLSADSQAAGRWNLQGGRGGVRCVGIGGALTGWPLDVLIIDDPVKGPEQAHSETYRQRAKDWWQAVARTRLAPGAAVVLVMTRWHEDDLAGWLLADGQDGPWRVISIPARAEQGDVLGRQPGEYLTSARGRTVEQWQRIERGSGPYVWGALYQQHPSPAEGNVFKRLWWRYWRPAPQLGFTSERIDCAGTIWQLNDCWRFGTVDLAASTKTSADWTVIAAWALTLDGDLVLLDRSRVRVDERGHFAAAIPLVERWGLDTLFIEASQFGTTLVRDATRAGVPISPLQADSDKLTRALPYSSRVAAGRVWLPAGQAWTQQWVDEHASFPGGRHDDQVDVGAYATRIAVTAWTPTSGRTTPAPAEHEINLMTVPM